MTTTKRNLIAAIIIAAFLSFASCSAPTSSKQSDAFKVEHPEWVGNATIYEVNVRQYTPEGTFEAFQQHLPRLKELGVDILWFMPIHPIGEVQRKGTLGSYYSVKNYKEVNPEFGTMDGFKALVKEAHRLGMKVIIDWVANHTAHDNPLVTEHPEWYTKDSVGDFVSPWDWTDVLDLDYGKAELQEYMIGALRHWLVEADIDGFRCDVAFLVPTEFWNRARKELETIKPVFMLAEAEEPELQEFAFDADYAWEFHNIMNGIAGDKNTVLDIDHYFLKELDRYPKNTIRMHFTSNHDENTWKGTEFERMGKAAKTFAALTFVIPGMPLIYSGQEVALSRRLEFFEKEQIDWTPNSDYSNLYKVLSHLKKRNTALLAGPNGADLFRVKTTNEVNVFAFTRENEKDKIFAIFNLSNLKQSIDLIGDTFEGEYIDILKNQKVQFENGAKVELAPWEFLIYEK